MAGRRGVREGSFGSLVWRAAPWVLLGVAGVGVALGVRSGLARAAKASPTARVWGKRLLGWAAAAAIKRISSQTSGATADRQAALAGEPRVGARDMGRVQALDPVEPVRAPHSEAEPLEAGSPVK